MEGPMRATLEKDDRVNGIIQFYLRTEGECDDNLLKIMNDDGFVTGFHRCGGTEQVPCGFAGSITVVRPHTT